MSHRSEVLSPEQWDTIAPLLPELMSRAPPWRSNRQLFEGILWLLTLRCRLARFTGHSP